MAGNTIELALLVLLALATTIQFLVKARNGKPHPAAETLGQLKEKVDAIEKEITRLRDWRHNDYVTDLNEWAKKFMTRTEAELLRDESQRDRERIWDEVNRLRGRK